MRRKAISKRWSLVA